MRRPELTQDGCLPGYRKLSEDQLGVMGTTECRAEDGARLVIMVQEGGRFITLLFFEDGGRLAEERHYGEAYAITHKVYGDSEGDYTEWSWNDEGALVLETEVRGGDHVRAATYHPNGRKASEGPFERTWKTGTWIYWDEDGREVRREVHEGAPGPE